MSRYEATSDVGRINATAAHDAVAVHPATAFVIGGPDGLDAQTRQAADFLLRLSALTLPHALAQVLLAEQLYRAWSILEGHPYHRA